MYYHQQPPYYPASGSNTGSNRGSNSCCDSGCNSGATTPKAQVQPCRSRPLSAPIAPLPSRKAASSPHTPDSTRRARSVGPRLMSGVGARPPGEPLTIRTPSEVTCSSRSSCISLSPSASYAEGDAADAQILADHRLPPGYPCNPLENYPDFNSERDYYGITRPSSSAQCVGLPWVSGGEPYPLQFYDCQYQYQYPYPVPDWVQIQMERNQAILNELAQNYAQGGVNSYDAETEFYGSLPQSNPWMHPDFSLLDGDISDAESMQNYDLDKEMTANEDHLWSTVANVDESEYVI